MHICPCKALAKIKNLKNIFFFLLLMLMNFKLCLLVPLFDFQTPAVAADSIHLILSPAYKNLFMDELFREGTL